MEDFQKVWQELLNQGVSWQQQMLDLWVETQLVDQPVDGGTAAAAEDASAPVRLGPERSGRNWGTRLLSESTEPQSASKRIETASCTWAQ